MKKFINNIYKNQGLIYKAFLFVITTGLIVYFVPKGEKFKYELTKGKPWQYETLYAPFDFSIQKSDEEIKQEKKNIRKNHSPYFDYDQSTVDSAKTKLNREIGKIFSDSIMDI